MRKALVLVLIAGLCACKPKPAADAMAAPSDAGAAAIDAAIAAADADRPHALRSRRPLISANKAPSAPTFRAGLWVQADKDCPFDETRSAGAWPNCARSMVVRTGQMLANLGHWGSLTYVSQTYVLEPGLPAILQLSGAVRRPDGRYAYEGLRTLSSDPDGRITRVRMWLPACGPAASSSDSSTKALSSDLWPGLRTSDSGGCLAVTAGPARAAIIAAEHADDDLAIEMHWVRDAEH